MSLGAGDSNNRGYYAISLIFWMQGGEISRIASQWHRTPQPNTNSTTKTSVLILPCCSWSGGTLHSSRAWPGLPAVPAHAKCPTVLLLCFGFCRMQQETAGRQQSTGIVLLRLLWVTVRSVCPSHSVSNQGVPTAPSLLTVMKIFDLLSI